MICYKKTLVWIIIILISAISPNAFSQNDFFIENDKGKFKQKFDLINDLVIIPVEVNGRELSFLLDTGVNSTIIFSLSSEDSTSLKNPLTVYLKGMGVGKPLRALKSNHNTLKVGDAISEDHSIYIIEGEVFSISNRLGFALNGILGYDFFKDFVVEFNYKRKFMRVYDKDIYNYDSCRRCVDLPLNFYQNKPYVEAEVSIEGEDPKQVDLLLDSGSGDALWLFIDEEKGIYLPDKSFEDFLGFGINGSVYGHRSRINALSLDRYDLEAITVSYPDSISLEAVTSFEEREGSIGAQVLKRFHSVMDYSGRNLRLKPNNDFHDPFEYNMSGVVVKHNGYRIVKNAAAGNTFQIQDSDPAEEGTRVYQTTRQVIYSLEPSYEIAEIRPDSPAEMSGLMIGDEIIKLNGRPAYKYNLQRISEIFSSKVGKRIWMEVLRDGKTLEIEFRLERIL
ncbi:aspartyl protease family protein [Gramella jeungdoensis]|uniref:Aspartyl protease family protein n=1 Tax=Gramella jeungdoensis TaxID=708091 RepID=A0ABT0YX78_9FLAO|nr:aspartyl protease family protein [Gramella jeungdoensis]MCM8567939.1 aspartyl protease family protein [Gramella jeungdoensis]